MPRGVDNGLGFVNHFMAPLTGLMVNAVTLFFAVTANVIFERMLGLPSLKNFVWDLVATMNNFQRSSVNGVYTLQPGKNELFMGSDMFRGVKAWFDIAWTFITVNSIRTALGLAG